MSKDFHLFIIAIAMAFISIAQEATRPADPAPVVAVKAER